MKNKTLIIILAITAILFITILILKLINNKVIQEDIELEKGVIENTNGILYNQEVDNIVFSNIKYTSSQDYTIISLQITNNNNETVILNGLMVNILDENGNIIDYLEPYSKEKLEPNMVLDKEFAINKVYENISEIEFTLPNLQIIE